MHSEIRALQIAREKRLKEFPGVDIDAIHYKRGAISDRLKKARARGEKYPEANVELTSKKERA